MAFQIRLFANALFCRMTSLFGFAFSVVNAELTYVVAIPSRPTKPLLLNNTNRYAFVMMQAVRGGLVL